jgi:hypothetical protein
MPGEPLSKGALIAAGWPDEPRLSAQSAAIRLKVAVNSLRKAGLEPLIVTVKGGYRLDPTLPVVVRDLADTNNASLLMYHR